MSIETFYQLSLNYWISNYTTHKKIVQYKIMETTLRNYEPVPWTMGNFSLRNVVYLKFFLEWIAS